MDEKQVEVLKTEATSDRSLQQTQAEIQLVPERKTIVTSENQPKAKNEHLENATGWESDNLIHDLEKELETSGYKKGIFDLEFKNPKHFTWLLVAFASMGGLLSGLDQSLISGANLTLPRDLGLNDRQNSLVNSGMPLGGRSC